MSSLITIAEALRDLNRIEIFDITEAQINHDDELVHFTNSLDNLLFIMEMKMLKAGENANGISFTQGFDDITDTPLQTLRKSKWMFGIGFDINKIETEPFHDARNRFLANSKVSRTELLQICDLCKMSNGDCWIKIRNRDVPIAISEDFYNYLMEFLDFQSKYFIRTHLDDTPLEKLSHTENPFISALQKYYSYEGENVDIKEYKKYRTGGGGNPGVYITGNPEYEIKGKQRTRSRSYYGKYSPDNRITAFNYLETLKLLSKASVAAKELKQKLTDASTSVSNSADITACADRLNDIIKSVNDSRTVQSLVTFRDNKQNLLSIHIDPTQQSQESETIEMLDEYQYFISMMDKEIRDDFQSPREDTSSVGGAIIFIEDRYMHELLDSISLDERERLFMKDRILKFELEDITHFYFPKVIKLADHYILDLEQLADLGIKRHMGQLSQISVDDVIKITTDKKKDIPQKVRTNATFSAKDFLLILKLLDYNQDKLKPYNKNQRISLR